MEQDLSAKRRKTALSIPAQGSAAQANAQKGAPVAYLGPAGTFTEHAARHLGSNNLFAFAHTEPALRALVEARVERAVIPWVNSRVGLVPESVESVRAYADHIKAEKGTLLSIRLCLYRRQSDKAQVKTVLGHPAALAQCQGRLDLLGVELAAASSNGAALKAVAEGKEEGVAALGPRDVTAYPGLHSDGVEMQDRPAKTLFLSFKKAGARQAGCLILFDDEDSLTAARKRAGRTAGAVWSGDTGCLLVGRPISAPPGGFLLGLNDGEGLEAAFP